MHADSSGWWHADPAEPGTARHQAFISRFSATLPPTQAEPPTPVAPATPPSPALSMASVPSPSTPLGEGLDPKPYIHDQRAAE